jgi:integrase
MRERTRRDGIYAAGAGRWRISVGTGRDPLTGEYGRVRETVVGTKRDAIRRRDELRVQAAHGVVVHADRETVATYVERWITHREHIGTVRLKTAYVYRGHVRRVVVPRVGGMRLADVRPAHVQRVLDEALEDGLSARTVTQVYRILHAAFRTGVQLQVLSTNPVDGCTGPKVEQARLRIPTPEEVAKVFANVDPFYRTALAVSTMTGLRRGEVLGLRWDGVDLDSPRPTARVDGSLQRTTEGLVVLPPKTERSRRTVPLPPTLVATLRRHRDEQDERRELAGDAWADGGFVFDAGCGQPVDPDAFGTAFRSARDRAGISGVRLHDLRHLFATLQIAEGTDARLVADLLGHSTVAFTLMIYTHPSADAAVIAAEKTERVLGAALES